MKEYKLFKENPFVALPHNASIKWFEGFFRVYVRAFDRELRFMWFPKLKPAMPKGWEFQYREIVRPMTMENFKTPKTWPKRRKT